jgi:hypothetical protein
MTEVKRKQSVFLLSPEDGNSSSFRNVVFSSYLKYRMMDKVHKLSDFEQLSCTGNVPQNSFLGVQRHFTTTLSKCLAFSKTKFLPDIGEHSPEDLNESVS